MYVFFKSIKKFLLFKYYYMQNKNKICNNCFGYKCNNILLRSKFYPYYECVKCFYKDSKILNKQVRICDDCKGYGLIKFKIDECITCNPSHKYCYCNNYSTIVKID